MTAPDLLVPPRVTSLVDIAQALVAGDKGLLAIDESVPTCNRRFAPLGITRDEPTRRAYCELIIITPRSRREHQRGDPVRRDVRQRTTDGVAFRTVLADVGIIAGINVDLGATPMAGHPGERVTDGLDGLRERLAGYAAKGARFARWRAVFTIGAVTRSRACIEANAHALARYAALGQEAGLVPIVEPEVLITGDHTLSRCGEVTEAVPAEVFGQLHTEQVTLEGMLLKPKMILAGSSCPNQGSAQTVDDATITRQRRAVPAAVVGIVILSGGQSGDRATARLAAINFPDHARLSWPVAFSFGRAIQQPALTIWDGQDANVTRAQQALLQRSTANHACRGKYVPSASTSPA
jgi:fructose-bisphosphate aldolase class I